MFAAADDKGVFQSTPSVGRATLKTLQKRWDIPISIHALRGEGDFMPRKICSHGGYFNPRPPWGGRLNCGSFLSFGGYDFNPRPPWGGRPACGA